MLLYPFVTASWSIALMGAVNKDLPFVPTFLTQLAATFLNLITPNGIGGTALQLDYLHKEGVPVASGASAMILSTGVGSAMQMALFLIAASFTSTSLRSRELEREHEPAGHRARGGDRRDRPRDPEDPQQGRAGGQAGRE